MDDNENGAIITSFGRIQVFIEKLYTHNYIEIEKIIKGNSKERKKIIKSSKN